MVPCDLDARTLALVQLAALVAVGGEVPSYGAHADAAVGAGATSAEIVDVLVAIVPIVGLPRVVAAGAAPRHGAGLRHRRCPRLTGWAASVADQAPSRPIAVACSTASWRDETPSLR